MAIKGNISEHLQSQSMWWLTGIGQASEIGMISNVTLNDDECKVACW